jgi:S-adenosylmethionine:tRNA ribosyltransferase-isomerase
MIPQKDILIDDFNYELPEEKIAFFPVSQRDQSKLLVYQNGHITDARFADLPNFLTPDYRLIFNDSKVIHARLLVHNATGAAIEIFCLEPLQPTTEIANAFTQTGPVVWKCLVGNAKRWKQPLSFPVVFDDKTLMITATKGECKDGAFKVTFSWPDSSVTLSEWLEQYGKMPIPPYIKRAAEKDDEQRYQTVYARYDGSVAAPTAGLHFSKPVIKALNDKGIATDYVTLHVGAGTFKPVSCERIGDHYMHREQIVISRQFIDSLIEDRQKKIVAVGTTVARTLESLYLIGAKLKLHRPHPLEVEQWEAYEDTELTQVPVEEALQTIRKYMEQQHTDTLYAATRLMIVPGYQRKLTQAIITNFHQPKSTLLLLISSFLGNQWKEVYAHALSHGYRFLSFGDSNLYL